MWIEIKIERRVVKQGELKNHRIRNRTYGGVRGRQIK